MFWDRLDVWSLVLQAPQSPTSEPWQGGRHQAEPCQSGTGAPQRIIAYRRFYNFFLDNYEAVGVQLLFQEVSEVKGEINCDL